MVRAKNKEGGGTPWDVEKTRAVDLSVPVLQRPASRVESHQERRLSPPEVFVAEDRGREVLPSIDTIEGFTASQL